MQFEKLTLKRCRYGWMLFHGPYIGKCFDLYGEYSESEVQILRALLRHGDVGIDVGANIGALTVPMSLAVGDAGRIFAIESHPANFNVLCANLALNGIQNVKPISAFVKQSEAVYDIPASFISQKWPPESLTIDALPLEACRLIKIDVDGGELEVLRSAEMTIERFRPFLYFENDVRDKSRELLRFAMETLEYRLHWHCAPIFQPDNFFGNRENHWAPQTFMSLMVLGVPTENRAFTIDLPVIKSIDEWRGNQ